MSNELNEHNIIDQISNKKIVVTGGTGMIGNEVCKILSSYEGNVTSISLDDLKPLKKVNYIKGDLSNFEFCKDILIDCDYLFHIAGIKGSVVVTKTKPASFFVPLLMMNTNILEAARLNKTKKILYTSSIGAYQPMDIFEESKSNFSIEPMDLYPGWAKRIAEMQIKSYLEEHKLLNFSIVRPCNVYGPGDNFDPKNAMVIPTLISKIHSYLKNGNEVVIWGDGSAERDFLFSRDCAKGIILACLKGTNALPINLGSGKGIKISELVETLNSIVSFKYSYDKSKPAGYKKRVMDISLAREKLNYNPITSLKDGLQETWEWYNKNLTQFKNKVNYFEN